MNVDLRNVLQEVGARLKWRVVLTFITTGWYGFLTLSRSLSYPFQIRMESKQTLTVSHGRHEILRTTQNSVCDMNIFNIGRERFPTRKRTALVTSGCEDHHSIISSLSYTCVVRCFLVYEDFSFSLVWEWIWNY